MPCWSIYFAANLNPCIMWVFGCNDIWFVCVIGMKQTCYCKDDTFKSLRFTLCVTVNIFILHVACIGVRSSQITPVQWLLPITTSRTIERRNCLQRPNAERERVRNSKRKTLKLESEEQRSKKWREERIYGDCNENSTISKAPIFNNDMFQLSMLMQFHKYCNGKKLCKADLPK